MGQISPLRRAPRFIDDGALDIESTATGADIDVVDLTIEGGDASGSFSGTEGTPVLPTVTVPPGTTLAWSVLEAIPPTAGTTCTVSDATTDQPSVTCNDNGEFVLKVEATLNAQTATASLPLHVANAAPELSIPELSPSGVVFPGSLITVSGNFTDAGTNDTHTCAVEWSDGVHTPGSTSGGVCTASRVLNDMATYTASMTVTDDDGGNDTRSTTEAPGGSVIVTTITIEPGDGPDGAYTSAEGSPVQPIVDAPAGATLSWSVTPVSVDAGASCTIVDGTTASPSITCTDDGTWTLHVEAVLGSHHAVADVPLVTTNAAPSVDTPSLSATVVPVNTTVTATAGYSDAGANDTHTCSASWDDGLTAEGGTIDAAAGTCSVTKSFAAAGVYRVTTTVIDDDGAIGAASFEYVVVYDPSAGFVTGGGHLDVQPGSYEPDASLGGKGTFGFTSKYKKGASTPTGNTEFQFHSGGLNFSSSTYQWLVVSGAKAQYKGTGTLNGVDGYGFLVTVTDGAQRRRRSRQVPDQDLGRVRHRVRHVDGPRHRPGRPCLGDQLGQHRHPRRAIAVERASDLRPMKPKVGGLAPCGLC